MRGDDAFEPHLGRMRARGGVRPRRYLARILAATNLARGSGAGRGRPAPSGRFGRTAGAGRAAPRRVMIKARIVRLSGKGAAGAVAHLRYIERDGTTREGDRGQAYGPETDTADGREFLARGSEDRHQFRFIVSAEDGADYEDLKPLTRRLMAQAEIDLGTQLDWVAVDHFNTGYPHTHIMLRGVDQADRDLVIPRDYLANGLRARAVELVELDLGPASPLRDLERARRDVTAERVTVLDRKFAAEAGRDHIVVAQASSPIEQALRTGRLAKLETLGLAKPVGAGRWQLEPDFTDTLQKMGERGDIIRTMQRSFTKTEQARAIADQQIYDPLAPGAQPLVGRVLARGLADEHRDHEFLIVDGVDGRTHYVRIGRGAIEDSDDLFGEGRGAAGATVRIAPRAAQARKADHVIASVVAANDGRYDGDAHRQFDPKASPAFIDAHVRRLEAVRRSMRLVERDAAGSWTVPTDFLRRVESMEAAKLRDRPVEVTVLATQSPGKLSAIDGATWLDRELVSASPMPLREAGFGLEVRQALQARHDWLAAEGLAIDPTDAGAKLLGTLRTRELGKAAAGLSRDLGLPYAPIHDGEQVTGIYRRRVDLASGRFALIERAHDFTLVPWRPPLERAIGRPIRAKVNGDRITWSFGPSRTGPGRGDL